MFHCKIDGDHIVLQHAKARSLYARLTGDSVGALTYNMRDLSQRGSRARANEQLIIKHLRALKAADPESFRREFVFHSEWGRDAVPTFLALLDAQRQLGLSITCSEIDRWVAYSSDPLLAQGYEFPDVIVISVFARSLLIFQKQIAAIEIPVQDVEHVFGTTGSFVLMTAVSKMVFSVKEGLLVERR